MPASTVDPAARSRPKFGPSDLGMLATTLVWAVNITVIKIGLRDLPPDAYNGLRLALASLVYLAILGPARRRETGPRLPPRRNDLWIVIGLGLAGITGYQLFFIQGLRVTPASTASMVMAVTPVFIALLSTALGQERLSGRAWAGILVSFGGFYALISHQNGAGFTWAGWRGAVFILAANACWAVYTVLGRPVLERIAPLRLAGLTTIAGTILYAPFAAAALRTADWSKVTWRTGAAIVYSGLFAIVFGFAVWYVSIRRIGSARTGTYSYLSPIFAALFAAAVLGERLDGAQIAAAAVILAGVALTRSADRRPG